MRQPKVITGLLAAAAALAIMPTAGAVTITGISGADTAQQAIDAVLAPSSGITVIGGSATFQNDVTKPQAGTYSGFNLAPSSGSTPTLTLANGLYLTSGWSNIASTNTANETSVVTPTGGHPLLTALANTILTHTFTNDANVLTFNFTLAPGQNAVSAQFVFGTEEFPTQIVTDIFGFFVDGVNYARFPSGELIANTPGNPTNFIANPVGGDLYDIEYNGLTRVLTVTGLIDESLSEHRITIGIADTADNRYDSGVFITGLRAGVADEGGIGDPDPIGVPAPGGLLTLAGSALAAWLARRRRRG
jgi:hypothetical protein